MSVDELLLRYLVFPDTKIDSVWRIRIHKDKEVCDLKRSIKAEHARRLNSVDAADLVLWKCSIPIDDDLKDTLYTITFDGSDARLQRIESAWQVSLYFPDGAQLPRATIHMLIQVPRPDTVSPLPPSRTLASLREERTEFVKMMPRKPPSELAQHMEFAKLQEDPKRNFAWSRPHATEPSVPVTLHHRIFRQFVEDCKTHRPTTEDNALVTDLSRAMSEFFQYEESRAETFREVMERHDIPFSATTITPIVPGYKGTGFDTDGDLQIDGHRYVIQVTQNDGGKGNTEPYAQALLWYFHSAGGKAKERPDFNFPCLIVVLMGAHISFSGAVWSDRPQFQVLSPALPLFWHRYDTDMRATLARHFGAFRKAIHALEECYVTLRSPTPLDVYSDPRFPDHHHYRSLDTDTDERFKYLSQIDRETLLFIAQTDNKETVCVKFARSYSKEAHQKCASMGIAPRLRGFETLAGGWKMVVMDMLDKNYVCIDQTTVPPGAYDVLKERLTELHQSDYVHGDVRDVNVLVRKDGTRGVMLVDFDWSGTVGEARYPMNVYKGHDLWRPEGVFDGELVMPEHDMAMLDRLFDVDST